MSSDPKVLAFTKRKLKHL